MAKELLKDVSIRTAKPKEKDYRLNDGNGLYIIIKTKGAKWWRYDYTINKTRKTLSLGVYPDITLADARDEAEKLRNQKANSIDPSLARKIENSGAAENTFKAIAQEFIIHKHEWSDSHRRHITECFERDVYPWLGDRPIKDLTPMEVLATLRRITDRGALETAARTKQFIGQAIRYGIATGRAERDVTQDLRGALPSPLKSHFPAITEAKPLGQLLRDIDAYTGSYTVRTALQLQPYIFARPANLAKAEWAEFDLEAAEWRIPANKMKMKETHIVPLSTQAIALLKDIQPLTGHQQHIFHSGQGSAPHISRETLGAAIRRMGYQGQHTNHGFRTTASTILHEQGYNSEMIERQLAHADRNKVRASYNHAQHLPERRTMMQAWADHLDSLKNGNIIPLKKTA